MKLLSLKYLIQFTERHFLISKRKIINYWIDIIIVHFFKKFENILNRSFIFYVHNKFYMIKGYTFL
jgi:hypothetical protein